MAQTNVVKQNSKLLEQGTHCDSPQDNSEFEVELQDFLVLTIDTDNKVNALKDRIKRGIRTVFTHKEYKLKKTIMVSIETLIHCLQQSKWIQSARCHLQKQDLLYELKIRDRFLRIEANVETTQKTYQRIGSTITIIGKVALWIQSKRWVAKKNNL